MTNKCTIISQIITLHKIMKDAHALKYCNKNNTEYTFLNKPGEII
jgi:hypothetical protein